MALLAPLDAIHYRKKLFDSLIIIKTIEKIMRGLMLFIQRAAASAARRCRVPFDAREARPITSALPTTPVTGGWATTTTRA